MKTRAGEWRRIDSGERSFAHRARPAVINAARARYLFAKRWCAGKRVCDVGCGSGVGAPLLAHVAGSLVGLDYSLDSLLFLRRSAEYPHSPAVAADACRLPFESGSFGVVIAFELIEHLVRPSDFLSEVRRVLAPSGTFILSTPNRPVYSPRGTWLDYHVREYDAAEFRALLAPHFPRLELYGQAQLSRDARLDMHPLNRFFYPLKRRLDPRGILLNKIRAAYVFLRWGERTGDSSPEKFPVLSDDAGTLPILVGVCSHD